METIKYRGRLYPKLQSLGNASQFAIPFARHFCVGQGYDIGCNRHEWAYPGSIPIDIIFDDPWDAYHLPDDRVDYIYSSHCLEHLPDWIKALDYWTSKLKNQGILFLYLPHYDQEYWRPWNNRKHLHVLSSNVIEDYMKDRGYKSIFVGEKDLNSSFMIVGEKGV
jgi:SAM-dependent methyltransferase